MLLSQLVFCFSMKPEIASSIFVLDLLVPPNDQPIKPCPKSLVSIFSSLINAPCAMSSINSTSINVFCFLTTVFTQSILEIDFLFLSLVLLLHVCAVPFGAKSKNTEILQGSLISQRFCPGLAPRSSSFPKMILIGIVISFGYPIPVVVGASAITPLTCFESTIPAMLMTKLAPFEIP